MSSEATDPMLATREHLRQIAEIWRAFARKKLSLYAGKVPPALRQKLGLSSTESPMPAPGEPVDATAA